MRSDPCAPPSIVFEDRRWSSAELIGIAARWREQIAENHEDVTTPLAMVLPNHPHGVSLFFALSSLRAPLVLLPTDPRAWRCSPPFVAGMPLFLPPSWANLSRPAEQAGFRPVVLGDVDRPADVTAPIAFLSCPGLVLFTSGSTSVPQPVYRSLRAFLDGARAFVTSFGLAPGSGVAGTLPLAYTHGLGQCLLAATVLGGSLGLVEQFDHRSVLALFASGDYQFCPGTPAMANILSRCPLPTIPAAPRVCTIGAGKIPEAVFRAFRDRFGVPLRGTYGTTEAGHITADTSPAALVRPETVGRPYPDVDVCIGETPDEPLPSGKAGNVWVKTSWGMTGYGFPPDVAPAPTLDGWSPTSDVGFLDDAGYLTLLGRSDDSVKLRSGYLVNLGDVAAALTGVPGVTDVAVVTFDAGGHQAIGALVEGEDLSAVELRRRMADVLPPWSLPQVVRPTARLPRLPGGKIDRTACVNALEQVSRAAPDGHERPE